MIIFKKFKISVLLLLFFLFFEACQKTEKLNRISNINFDFITWNKFSLVQTKKFNLSYKKIITINNAQQIVALKNNAWLDELKFLEKFDLNKPENKDKYRQYSYANDSLNMVSYAPIKKNIFKKLRLKIILTKSNLIKEVIIIENTNTGIFNFDKKTQIIYDITNSTIKELHIKSKTTFLYLNSDSVLVQFIPKSKI